jgi:hypothetical protein
MNRMIWAFRIAAIVILMLVALLFTNLFVKLRRLQEQQQQRTHTSSHP